MKTEFELDNQFKLTQLKLVLKLVEKCPYCKNCAEVSKQVLDTIEEIENMEKKKAVG